MKFILPILLFLSSICVAHPIHVSVCEINHNAEKSWLEITIRIFADDFEDVLEDRKGVRTKLGTTEELAETNDYIAEYLKEKFAISINGKAKSLAFISKDVEDLSLICKLYILDVKEISTMKVKNEVMTHWFKDQVNVTHIDCNNELKSTFFDRGRMEEDFKW